MQFEGNIGDSITVDAYDTRAPFRVKNVTHGDEPPFRISDYDRDDEWDPDEPIMLRPYPGEISPLITIRFFQDSISVTETVIFDTVETDSGLIISDTTLYDRSEEHTSELQSQAYLVCRLLLEKKKNKKIKTKICRQMITFTCM